MNGSRTGIEQDSGTSVNDSVDVDKAEGLVIATADVIEGIENILNMARIKEEKHIK